MRVAEIDSNSLAYHRACSIDDVIDGDVKKVKVAGLTIALFNLGGKFFAMDHLCTHEEVSLVDGFVIGDEIECPLHSGRFNIRTGKAVSAPCVVDARTFAVTIQGKDVMVGIPANG